MQAALEQAKERQGPLEVSFADKQRTLEGIKQSALGDWSVDLALLPESVRHFTGDEDDRKALMAFQRTRNAATKAVVAQVGHLNAESDVEVQHH